LIRNLLKLKIRNHGTSRVKTEEFSMINQMLGYPRKSDPNIYCMATFICWENDAANRDCLKGICRYLYNLNYGLQKLGLGACHLNSCNDIRPCPDSVL
jgi:hypothetical protein